MYKDCWKEEPADLLKRIFLYPANFGSKLLIDEHPDRTLAERDKMITTAFLDGRSGTFQELTPWNVSCLNGYHVTTASAEEGTLALALRQTPRSFIHIKL